ncbi:MAG: sigma-54-dependent Fis family transcriptional regulator [Blastocatellia bacterium]|nr:sigma-54-dependent Fis family transcriptional regulator [Blastocatellia bacterium]
MSETLAALLDQEQRANQTLISSLIEQARVIQGSSADRRLQRFISQLKSLQERLDLMSDMARRDFLLKIGREAEELMTAMADSRAARVLMSVVENASASLNLFCESLLDSLIEVAEAQKGFILFYLPESSEAQIIAARNFETTDLSLEEYDVSRTLLRSILDHRAPLLLEDASQNPAYSNEASIVKFGLKSVLAVPLKHRNRAIGALYIEDNSRPCAFDHEDQKLLENVAEFVIFYLDKARLLPIVFEEDRKVFIDADRASKEIVGRDPKILSLLEMVKRLADSPATVLIEGESGTGKELVARALHYQSARRDHPFVVINCAAIPENLLESELFGHEKGAFTGATSRYLGRLEPADGGTVFLDEISELAYPLQAKLLRFLQSNEFDRLGAKKTVHVDVRIVAATSKDLKVMTEAGNFQEALYYRLNVIPVRLPSLRERKDDIPCLIDYFLGKFSDVYGKVVRAEGEVYEWLKEYSFPGNVRELENLIHRMVALAEGDVIRVGDLPGEILQITSRRIDLKKEPLYRALETPPASLDELRRRKSEVRRVMAEHERRLIERVIEESGGNLTEAASRLGVHRITLHKMLKKTRKPSED